MFTDKIFYENDRMLLFLIKKIVINSIPETSSLYISSPCSEILTKIPMFFAKYFILMHAANNFFLFLL